MGIGEMRLWDADGTRRSVARVAPGMALASERDDLMCERGMSNENGSGVASDVEAVVAPVGRVRRMER